MRQIPNYGDRRNQAFCVHCGGAPDTRDHSPSKVLLDDPLPKELPVLPACSHCNNSFSLDEECVACLIDCILAGSADPNLVRREKVRRLLVSNLGLAARIKEARYEKDGKVLFAIEAPRIEHVLLKLARGHAAFELNEPQLEAPKALHFAPFDMLSDEQGSTFETPPAPLVFPEVGSRGLTRFIEEGGCQWIVVQLGRYRYLVSQNGSVTVRMVLSEYLACEVAWL